MTISSKKDDRIYYPGNSVCMINDAEYRCEANIPIYLFSSTAKVNLISPKALIAITRSRTAMSKKVPCIIKFKAIKTSQIETIADPILVLAKTIMPAIISIIPTICINPSAVIGKILTTKGFKYITQSTRRFENLSNPATIGTMPNVYLKIC